MHPASCILHAPRHLHRGPALRAFTGAASGAHGTFPARDPQLSGGRVGLAPRGHRTRPALLPYACLPFLPCPPRSNTRDRHFVSTSFLGCVVVRRTSPRGTAVLLPLCPPGQLRAPPLLCYPPASVPAPTACPRPLAPRPSPAALPPLTRHTGLAHVHLAASGGWQAVNGNEEQRNRWLPDACSGAIIGGMVRRRTQHKPPDPAPVLELSLAFPCVPFKYLLWVSLESLLYRDLLLQRLR